MSKYVVPFLITLFFIIFLNDSSAQRPGVPESVENRFWFDMMQDPNANFYETQKAFYKYFENRDKGRGTGYKIFKRWEYINQPRILPNGTRRPPDYVANAYNEYKKNHSSSRSSSGTWSLVGPSAYPNNSTSQPTGMGRINAIAFHPTNEDIIFVGAPSGGFWKTINGGSSWINLTSNLPTLGVSSILIHPTDPDIIYLGSGDRDSKDAPGMGVFKSFDGGSNWSQLNGPNEFNTATVHAMAMDPNSVNVIIAGTSDGLYRTSDGGINWNLRVTGSKWKDVKFKPGSSLVVYAVHGGSFYRSSNGGVSGWLPAIGIPISGKRLVIGTTAADPTYVYLAQTNNNSRSFAGLMRSVDNGQTFTTKSTTPNIYGYKCYGNDTTGQAYYDLCINVDPEDKNIVYVGAINNWKSTDGGATLNIISHWYPSHPIYPCPVAAAVHADQHALEWSPHNGNLYAGHDGGISWTGDGGTTWTEISSGLEIAQVYKIGQNVTSPGLTLNGYQDNGSAVRENGNFTTVVANDGMECIIDYTNSNIRYVSLYDGLISRSLGSGYSYIAGKNINGINEDGDWVTPYLLHETDPNTMFAGYKNVWRSNNVKIVNPANVTWEAISVGETDHCEVLEQCAADLDILYVSRNSILMRSDNANAIPAASVSWSACASPDTFSITDLETHPTDPNIVYATSGNNIYKSSDKGVTWADISGSLPSIPINCLVYDYNSDGGLYVGTQAGVWYRDATTADWIVFSDGLPIVDVRELEIYVDPDPANSKLMAATYGRGLWESDLYVTTRQSFITTWKTDNPGTSNNTSITIPTFPGETYNYQVDWDNDGIYDTTTYTGNATHDYLTQDTVTIAIRGTFPRIFFDNGGDKEKILLVEQWGINRWTSMNNAFAGAVNLTSAGLDVPVLDSVTDMSGMFYDASSFDEDISAWDVSNVTNMSGMFHRAIAFSQDIAVWNVDSVTNMSSMFQAAYSFNGDISTWNVENVTDMSNMFYQAYSFNGDVSTWDVGNVTDMSNMFYQGYSFAGNPGGWTVDSVTNMSGMFGSAFQFNRDLNSWDVSNVTDMDSMFFNANNFNGDISSWNVGNVNSMEDMFNYAQFFNQDIGAWNTSGVTDMSGMFFHADQFNHSLGEWTISSVADMEDMLSYSGLSLTNYDSTLIGWHGQAVSGQVLGAETLEYCHSEFEREELINVYGWMINGDIYKCKVFITSWNTMDTTTITIPTYPGEIYNYDIDWDNDGVYDDLDVTTDATHDYGALSTACTIRIRGTFPGIYLNLGPEARKIRTIEQWGMNIWQRMDHAFEGARDLISNAIDTPEVSGVSDMSNMFRMARLYNENIGSWDVSNVTDMSYMFWGAVSFNQDINSWDVSNVTDMSYMFAGTGFNQDLNLWNVGSVTDMSYMFWGGLGNHLFNGNVSTWNVSNVTNMDHMFEHAVDFNGDVSGWIVSSVTNMSNMFYATSINSDLSNWNVANVTDMSGMFAFTDAFNQDISGWDVSNVTDMSVMFAYADAFNQDISGWDVANVSDMTSMFFDASLFDQNLGPWELSSSPDLDAFLSNSNLSVDNYDNTLIGWESQGISDLTLGASNLEYCNADAERDSLIYAYGWNIYGDTYDCSGLPIELFEFRVRLLHDKSVLLQWKTAFELNNQGFEVKKSLDGKRWEIIGFLESCGTDVSFCSYNFMDEYPQPGVNYYVLCQKDYNGEEQYSMIQSVFVPSDKEVSLFPNPSNGLIKITGKDITGINVFSTSGIILHQHPWNNTLIDISELPNGIYIVAIRTKGGMVYERIVKY